MFGSFSCSVVCLGRTFSFTVSAQIVHCNSPRDMRRKSGLATLVVVLPQAICLQEGWGAAAGRVLLRPVLLRPGATQANFGLPL